MAGLQNVVDTLWISVEIHSLEEEDNPDDEWYNYIGKVNAVDSAMATQAARDHLHPDALLIVVVGDREKIETGIRELGLGEVCFVDAEGNQVSSV